MGTGGVSDFWSRAIANNPMIMMGCEEKDKPILEYVTNVSVDKRCLTTSMIHVQLFFSEN